MTGYGRGDCSQDGFKITVELSSVNRKQTEISVNLPREMEMLEAPIRDVINRYIARGRLTVRVALHAGGNSAARMHLNLPLAKAYVKCATYFEVDSQKTITSTQFRGSECKSKD